ncbi:BrnT family toxin [Novosphingobium kaempferiae]|uniref:BrnT family toxin n=1 Tax=Novosphingobium kaempferiae TaxID=2896849 RepID=UPI001E53EA08|nr:BrnT family toxin [Novosphingobium kaempferiae]
MEFEFDPAKDDANRAKHGLGLAFGMRVFDDPRHEVLPSFRPVDGEDRYKAVGLVDGRLFTLIYVWRDERIRLISVRRSNTGEQRDYDRHSG